MSEEREEQLSSDLSPDFQVPLNLIHQGAAGGRSKNYPLLNIRELAKRCRYTEQYVGMVLNGRRVPSVKALTRIADELGIGAGELLKLVASIKQQAERAQLEAEAGAANQEE